jgi:hypothetical protein
MKTFGQRVTGALMLDNATYEEVEHDPEAMGQAATLVTAVAVIGGVLGGAMTAGFITGLIGHLVSTFVGWIVWSVVIWLVGTQLFKADADVPEMLKVFGFAYTPAVLLSIPLVNVLALLWLLATSFVAARAGLDLDDSKTIVTIVVGLIVTVVVQLLILVPLGLASAVVGGLF